MSDADEVLSRINHIRAAYRLVPLGRLVAGQKGIARECVLSRSLRQRSGIVISVTSVSIVVTSKAYAEVIAREFGVEVRETAAVYQCDTPELFQDFIDDFDSGLYPELVAN